MRRRIRYAFVFTALAAACVYWGVQTPWWAAVPLVMVATAFAIVGLAFATANPMLFLKSDRGTITPVMRLALWPYLLLNDVLLVLIAKQSGENALDEIDAGVWLGRRLRAVEARAAFPDGIAGTVDLTAEFTECKPLREGPYLLVPTLDTLEPTLAQLQAAVAFIDEHRETGPVYIHCAMGHGRSATVVAAWVMASRGLGVQDAIGFVKDKRPGIDLHTEQLALLEAYQPALPGERVA